MNISELNVRQGTRQLVNFQQSATSNNIVLGGVMKLSSNSTHFIWGVTQELLRVTEIFRDQCNQSAKQMKVDSIPVLKAVPCYDLIKTCKTMVKIVKVPFLEFVSDLYIRKTNSLPILDFISNLV
jgi:hypothetical protein